jgi:NADH:ubiquinone oxidoreductase subunit C
MSDLADEQAVLDTLKEEFGDRLLEAQVDRPRRLSLKMNNPDQLDFFNFAKKKWGAWHLVGISGVDTPEDILCVVYHFDVVPPSEKNRAITVSIRVDTTDRENPEIQTVTHIIPGATFPEREAHDLFGITFKDHPSLERLILPDDFPEEQYPLRKDFLLEIQKKEKNKGKK